MRDRFGFIFLVTCSIGLAMLACNFGASLPNATAAAPIAPGAPLATNSSPGAAVLPSGDPKQAVIDAFTKLDSAYPYRLTETDSTNICGQQLRTVEFASKDEWHATWSGCQTGEIISTGGTTYYLNNGSWSTSGEAPAGSEEQAHITDLIKAALTNVQAAGSENLNGVATNVYTFDLSDPVLNVKGGKVWIGAADGLPHQAEAPFALSGISVNTKLVYEFGISVNIKAPIP